MRADSFYVLCIMCSVAKYFGSRVFAVLLLRLMSSVWEGSKMYIIAMDAAISQHVHVGVLVSFLNFIYKVTNATKSEASERLIYCVSI